MLRFMKYKIGIPLLIIAALAAFFSFKYKNEDVSSDAQRRAIILNTVMGIITEAHYAPRPLDDSFSNKVFNKWLENTDFEKKIFTKENINALETYRYQLDDQILASNFEAYDLMEQLYSNQLQKVEQYYKSAIKEKFEFNKNDSILLNPDKIDFAENDKALQQRWQKYIKYRVLAMYVEMKKTQKDELHRRDTLKVKDTTAFVVKSDETLLKSAVGKIDTNLQKFFTKLKKYTKEERFALYVNAIAQNEDPHTDFFPPREKKNFDVQMSGEFYGIGAQLKPEGDKIIIASIVPGSPSWKQGELKANDEIIKVGQGSAEPEDIQGYDLEDVVQKIRGEKGTEVRLTVRRVDGSIKVIPIIRGKVALEETFAKSLIINTDKGKMGYIYLSEFYSNFNSADGRRSATDVAKEVEKLKKENIKGLILDLRFNGGGSLNDVVEMTGLFVGAGPVVQVKSSQEQAVILKSKNTVTYDGPLVVMVNQASASASEILAAALQDYNRAIVVGNTTFGKGTVQKQIPLDDFVPPMVRLKMMSEKQPEIGALKLTIQKFYRINGGSTQLKGVTPDITIPDLYSDLELGERKDKSALPYDEILPATIMNMPQAENSVMFKTEMSKNLLWPGIKDLSTIKAHSEKRIQDSKAFKIVQENAARLKKMEQNNMVYLNEAAYKKQIEENSAISKKMDEIEKLNTSLDLNNMSEDQATISADTARSERNKNWIRLLKKDITLSETVNILKEMKPNKK